MEEERNTKAGNELETEIEDREDDAHEHDVMLQKEANQRLQTGTNDATHLGIRWGSSYKTKRKTGTRGRSKKLPSNDSESKPRNDD